MLEAEGVSFAVLGTVCYTQETGLHVATTEHGTQVTKSKLDG